MELFSESYYNVNTDEFWFDKKASIGDRKQTKHSTIITEDRCNSSDNYE